MINERVMDETSILIELSNETPKHKPSVSVNLITLLIEITDYYDGNILKEVGIDKIVYDCLGEDGFYSKRKQKFCGCCSRTNIISVIPIFSKNNVCKFYPLKDLNWSRYRAVLIFVDIKSQLKI